MANLKGCFLHNTDHWRTPSKMYEYYMKIGYLDPCPFMSDIDNLNKTYDKGTRLFINPPYSQLDKWVDFAIRNYLNGCHCLLLIPARTDTKYFHRLLYYRPIIYFIKGRLHFNDSKNGAPFPSIIVYISIDNILPMCVPYFLTHER